MLKRIFLYKLDRNFVQCKQFKASYTLKYLKQLITINLLSINYY